MILDSVVISDITKLCLLMVSPLVQYKILLFFSCLFIVGNTISSDDFFVVYPKLWTILNKFWKYNSYLENLENICCFFPQNVENMKYNFSRRRQNMFSKSLLFSLLARRSLSTITIIIFSFPNHCYFHYQLTITKMFS